MLGPIMHGSLVRLVPPAEAMIPQFVRWFADTEVTRYLTLQNPPSVKMEEEWLDRIARSETNILWAITAGDQTIGTIGIHAIDWRHRQAQTGTVIGERECWRRGYASEAMLLRTRYAFEELNLEKLTTRVFAENVGSRRALERAGYRQCGLARKDAYMHGRWHDSWLGELLREEWEQPHQE